MHHGAIPAKYNHTKIIPRRLHPLSWMFQAIAATVGCCPRTATRLYSVASTVGVGSRGTHTPPQATSRANHKNTTSCAEGESSKVSERIQSKTSHLPHGGPCVLGGQPLCGPQGGGRGPSTSGQPCPWIELGPAAPSSAYHLPELASNPPGAIFFVAFGNFFPQFWPFLSVFNHLWQPLTTFTHFDHF